MKPRLLDDQVRPELDLHGCSVDEALRLSRALITESARRGRDSVRIIHGKSTTGSKSRTIKSALTELIDSGQLSLHVASTYKSEGHMLVALRKGGNRYRSNRITLRDIKKPP